MILVTMSFQIFSNSSLYTECMDLIIYTFIVKISHSESSKQGVLALVQQAYYASQGWIMTFVVGIVVGIAASLVDKGMEWVSGFREGVCVNWFLATEKRCCVDVPGM